MNGLQQEENVLIDEKHGFSEECESVEGKVEEKQPKFLSIEVLDTNMYIILAS